MKATACLLSWKRQYHLPAIIESLRSVPEIDEILIFSNEFKIQQDFPGVRVIHSPENMYVYGRFLAAAEAKNSICYTQDDDLIAHNISELITRHYLSGSIVANLADDKSSRHWSHWMAKRPPWVELGFGSVFCRDMVDVLGEWPYDRELLLRKADKVISVMHPWECVQVTNLTRLRHKGKESGFDRNALSRRDDHKRKTKEAVRLAQEWKKCRQEN